MAEYIVKESGYPGTLSHEVVGELIRCRDCKYYEQFIPCVGGTYNGCGVWLDDGNQIEVEPNGYCSYAERKEGAEG